MTPNTRAGRDDAIEMTMMSGNHAGRPRLVLAAPTSIIVAGRDDSYKAPIVRRAEPKGGGVALLRRGWTEFRASVEGIRRSAPDTSLLSPTPSGVPGLGLASEVSARVPASVVTPRTIAFDDPRRTAAAEAASRGEARVGQHLV
jgi:hypothetical protein